MTGILITVSRFLVEPIIVLDQKYTVKSVRYIKQNVVVDTVMVSLVGHGSGT